MNHIYHVSYVFIPHICHGPTGQARGERSVLWRNFKFLYMKHAYLIFVAGRRAKPVEKKSVMYRNFKFLFMKDVEKAKISPYLV